MYIPTNTTLFELGVYFNIFSWLDLYKHIEARKMTDTEFVDMAHAVVAEKIRHLVDLPNDDPQPVIKRRFYIADVKAKAFDELYSKLPLQDSKALIHEIVTEMALYGGKHTQGDVHTFIDNIPTRYNEE